jgi:hypothetical protein
VLQVVFQFPRRDGPVRVSYAETYDPTEYRLALDTLPFGKRLPGAIDFLVPGEDSRIPSLLRIMVAALRKRMEIGAEFNLLKFHTASPKISFLAYPDFEKDPHPGLKEAVIVDLVTGKTLTSGLPLAARSFSPTSWETPAPHWRPCSASNSEVAFRTSRCRKRSRPRRHANAKPASPSKSCPPTTSPAPSPATAWSPRTAPPSSMPPTSTASAGAVPAPSATD